MSRQIPLVCFSQEKLKHMTTERLVPTNVHSSFVHNPKPEITYASYQVILSQIQIHLSLSGFVTPELEPASISSLPTGTMSGFVRLRILQERYKVISAGRHFPSGCQSFSHIFTQPRD